MNMLITGTQTTHCKCFSLTPIAECQMTANAVVICNKYWCKKNDVCHHLNLLFMNMKIDTKVFFKRRRKCWTNAVTNELASDFVITPITHCSNPGTFLTTNIEVEKMNYRMILMLFRRIHLSEERGELMMSLSVHVRELLRGPLVVLFSHIKFCNWSDTLEIQGWYCNT